MEVPHFEDKSLIVLRRKFLVALPVCSITGYMGAKIAAGKIGLSKWPRRAACIAGAIIAPVVSCMMIVHFNRAEIFRVGSGMLHEMEQLRKLEQGPFSDPAVRGKWDQQMRDRTFNLMKPDPHIAQEFNSSIDYESIISDSLRK
jgi:hypothetical protein